MAVMRELCARGRRVRIVNRSGKADVPSGVEVTQADVADLAAARQAGQGAHVTPHAEAIRQTVTWYRRHLGLPAATTDVQAVLI